MTQSFTKNYIHVVFCTKERREYLIEPIHDNLFAYGAGILNSLGSPLLAVNGTKDHIHLLVHLSKNVALAKMVEDVKRGTSRWMKQQGRQFELFGWQVGYSAFSVSESLLPTVANYIANQKEHHRKRTFLEEWVALMKKHKIEFDINFPPR